MTRDELNAKILKVSELCGDNEEIMTELKAIQDSPVEIDSVDTDGVTWRQKYEDMKTQYRERFFETGTTPVEKDPPLPEDPAESITFDDLFKE